MDTDSSILYMIIAGLIALSAIFSSAETAFLSTNRIRMRNLHEDGEKRAGLVLNMLENQKIAAAENREIFGCEKLHTFVSQRTLDGDLLIMRAHCAARDAMKEICPHLKIGLTLSLHDIQSQWGGKKHADKEWYAEFGHYLPYIREDDFLGVQNYSRSRFGLFGQLDAPANAELTQMG